MISLFSLSGILQNILKYSSHKNIIIIFLLTISCQKSKNSLLNQENESTEKNISESGGEIDANQNSEIAGSELVIPAGALSIPSTIKLETGSDIAHDGVIADLELGSDVAVTKSKPAVSITTSSNTNPVNPLSLSIPLSLTSLTADTSNYIVIYKAIIYGESSKYLLGIIPASKLTFSSTSVKFDISYFGSYQLATTTSAINQEKSVETSIPFISKTAANKLTPIQMSDPTFDYDSATRKTKFSFDPGAQSFAGCSIIIDDDKSSPWKIVTKLGTATSYEASPLNSSAHSIYGKFICVDSNGRSATGNWSNISNVEAEVTAPAITYPSALTSFTSTIPRGRHSVKLSLTYPANVADYQTLNIYRSAGSSAPTCGSGTLVTTYTSSFSGSVHYYDIPGAGSFSYRACILGSGGGITDSNTVSSSSTNTQYVMFLTSQGYTANLSSTFDGQTFADGYAGADYRCKYHATQANLGGNWKALLGGSTTAISRIAPTSGNTIVDVAGTTVISLSSQGFWTKLLASDNSACVNSTTPFTTNSTDKDETGATHSSANSYFWTGTNAAATSSANHCTDWTSISGNGARGYPTCTGGGLWMNYGSSTCSSSIRLLCVSAD